MKISDLAQLFNVTEANVRSILNDSGMKIGQLCNTIWQRNEEKAKILLRIYISKYPRRTPSKDTPNIDSGQIELSKKIKRIKSTHEERKIFKLSEWKQIGPEQEIIHLSSREIIQIHNKLVDDFSSSKDPIDPPGLRSMTLLESAAARPLTSIGTDNKYKTIAMAAAALLHSLVLNHPFHNGNKRTALVAMLVFLDRNGWLLNCQDDEIFELLINLADHRLAIDQNVSLDKSDCEVISLAKWLRSNTRKIGTKEKALKFHQIRSLLYGYGCELEHPGTVGNRINIRRGDLRTQVAYRNEGADVDKGMIHKIRKDLSLDEASGYDSDIFYNSKPRVATFIQKYRKLLNRLAKI